MVVTAILGMKFKKTIRSFTPFFPKKLSLYVKHNGFKDSKISKCI